LWITCVAPEENKATSPSGADSWLRLIDQRACAQLRIVQRVPSKAQDVVALTGLAVWPTPWHAPMVMGTCCDQATGCSGTWGRSAEQDGPAASRLLAHDVRPLHATLYEAAAPVGQLDPACSPSAWVCSPSTWACSPSTWAWLIRSRHLLKAAQDHLVGGRQLFDVVGPELQHFAPLGFVLGPVVHTAHAADGVIQRLFDHV
jgi:hypothetical protein